MNAPDPAVAELLEDPFLRAYKDDPRFIAFAQKIGVMPKAAAKPCISRFSRAVA